MAVERLLSAGSGWLAVCRRVKGCMYLHLPTRSADHRYGVKKHPQTAVRARKQARRYVDSSSNLSLIAMMLAVS
jgi:hypothetical protein